MRQSASGIPKIAGVVRSPFHVALGSPRWPARVTATGKAEGHGYVEESRAAADRAMDWVAKIRTASAVSIDIGSVICALAGVSAARLCGRIGFASPPNRPERLTRRGGRPIDQDHP